MQSYCQTIVNLQQLLRGGNGGTMASFAKDKTLHVAAVGFVLFMLCAPCAAYATDYDYIAADGRPFAATPTQEELDQIAILEANAENGIAPQTSSDSYFAFNLKDNTTAAASPATKDDDSSTYVYATKKNVKKITTADIAEYKLRNNDAAQKAQSWREQKLAEYRQGTIN